MFKPNEFKEEFDPSVGEKVSKKSKQFTIQRNG